MKKKSSNSLFSLQNHLLGHVFASIGLYYKPMLIVNDDSSIISKLETSLIDDARVVIYDCHMFIVKATGTIFTTVHFLYVTHVHNEIECYITLGQKGLSVKNILAYRAIRKLLRK